MDYDGIVRMRMGIKKVRMGLKRVKIMMDFSG